MARKDRVLLKALKSAMGELDSTSIQLTPVAGNDLTAWRVLLKGCVVLGIIPRLTAWWCRWPPGSALAQDLRALQQQFRSSVHAGSIELLIRFPTNWPNGAPLVREVSPQYAATDYWKLPC